MSVLQDVRAALETRLAGTPGLPAARAWESVHFDPPTAGTPYVRATFQPTSSRAVTVGSTPLYTHSGVFLIDLLYPSGVGPQTAEGMADAIRLRFPVTVTLAQNGSQVRIRYAERGPGLPVDGRFLVPVTVAWRCHSAQP